MRRLLGEDYARYERTFFDPPARALRINTAKITADRFDAIFPLPTSPLSYEEAGRLLLSDAKVGADPLHAAGLYYMQDPGAMSSVAALPEIRGRGLDVAAAARALGVPAGTVKFRLFEARRRLRRALGWMRDAPPPRANGGPAR